MEYILYMKNHVLINVMKKIISVILVLTGVTFLSFLLMYLSPGDPASMMLKKSGMSVSEEAVEAKREELGLNDSFIVQYGNWLKGIAKGDMGISYKSGKPVAEQLKGALPYTLYMAALSFLLIVLISTPVGILCAYKKDRLFDHAIRVITYLMASLPSFFIGLILMYLFCLKMKLLPVISKGNPHGIVLPVMVLTVTLSAWYIRQVRGIALSELQKDYITGLRARQIPETRILFAHLLKNCMLPFIALFGMSAGSLLGGSAVVESIFTWPGIGKLAVDAITYRDYPIIQGFVLWMSVMFLIVNGLVDILSFALDPRVKKERGGKYE